MGRLITVSLKNQPLGFMGNDCCGCSLSDEQVKQRHQNILTLVNLGKQSSSPDKERVVALYQTFYHPKDSLERITELQSDHYLLRQTLKAHIQTYNERFSTKTHEALWVERTYHELKPTLALID